MGRSRASYYKQRSDRSEAVLDNSVVRELIMEKRRRMPRIGGRKLYSLIKEDLDAQGIKMGRDKLFEWLRERDLLVKPKKSFTRTTKSNHHFRVHKNLIKGVELKRADQIWVSDITYLRTGKGFCYLALITDAYSRKIVGYDVSNSLELSGCLRALKKASINRATKGTIHHSDRGIQYCSHAYVNSLRDKGIKISMAEAGNCYENALAERVNGILKNEFNLDRTFSDLESAKKHVNQAIKIYNNERPHMSLEMKMPNEIYAAAV